MRPQRQLVTERLTQGGKPFEHLPRDANADRIGKRYLGCARISQRFGHVLHPRQRHLTLERTAERNRNGDLHRKPIAQPTLEHIGGHGDPVRDVHTLIAFAEGI